MKGYLYRGWLYRCGCALITSVVLAGLFCRPALAVPARPGFIEVVQPDGHVIEVTIKGDESRSWIETLSGYSIVKNPADAYWHYATLNSQGKLVASGVVVDAMDREQPAMERHLAPLSLGADSTGDRLGRLPGSSPDGPTASAPWDPLPVPVSGTREVIVIMVGFADIDITTSLDGWYGQIFGDGPTDISVANFYRDNSSGLVSLAPAAHSQPGSPAGIVKVRLDTNHPDYGFDSSYEEDVWLAEAALAAAAAFVDFDGFDKNGDGTLPSDELAVYFVIAGYEASGSARVPNIWAHAYRNAQFAVGTKVVRQYGLNGELSNAGLLHPLGVVAHELGHSLFLLPDLYDTSTAATDNQGLGYFSLMATGSWGGLYGDDYGTLPVNLDAWSRLYLGWAKPAFLAPDGGTQPFAPACAPDSVVRLGDMPASPTDYFLLENRAYNGWDRGLDIFFPWSAGDGGLLALHVDTTVGTNNSSSVDHQGVVIVEANSTYCSPTRPGSTCRGHYTNLFYDDNNTAFTEITAPAALFYTGNPVPTTLWGISTPAPLMSGVLSRFNRGGPTAFDASAIVYQNTAYTGTLGHYDPDDDTCNFTVQSAPSKGTLELDRATGGFTYTSNPGEEGIDTFTYYASDGELSSAPATVTLNIVVPNYPPLLDVGAPQLAVSAGRVVDIALAASDPDGHNLVWDVSGLPPGSSLDPDTLVFRWRTKLGDAGVYTATFRVADDGVPPEKSEAAVTITVTEPTTMVAGGGGCFLENLLR